MKRPRMTDAVRRGLSNLVEYGRSWREADLDETLTAQEVKDCDAAMDWVERGGLVRTGPDPEDLGEPGEAATILEE